MTKPVKRSGALILLLLTACAGTPYRDRDALRADRIAREAHDKQAAEEARLRAEARAIELAKTEKAGTPEAAFLEAHGQPLSEELIDGATVYRYSDGETPMIFEFKGGKLTGKRIDRDRLRDLAERDRQRDEADRSRQEHERTRKQMLIQSMQNSPVVKPQPAYQVPVRKTTNCTTRAIGGGTVTTVCD